jgi:hypothetical protein
MRVYLWILVAAILASVARAEAVEEVLGPRLFTDVDGRTMMAAVVGLEAKELRVRRTDVGGEFVVPLERLSALDRRYLEENREEIMKRLAVAPETEFTRALRKDFVRADPRSGALGPVPAEAWAKVKWFVLVTGVPEDAGVSRVVGASWAAWAAEEGSVALLWVGPAVHGAEPTPEFERRLAGELPANVVLLGGAARREAFAREREELRKIAEEQAPGRAGLFFNAWQERTAGEREEWLRRVLARQAPYWSGWVDASRRVVSAGETGPRIFVCDREGKAAPVEVIMKLKAPGSLLPFPERVPPVAVGERAAPMWTEFAAPPTHVFRVRNGTWRAKVVGMTAETVVVRPGGGKTERLIGMASVSAEDRAALEKMRVEAAQAASAVEAIPAREVSGSEQAKAGRFAVNVLLRRDGSISPQVMKWMGRPRLTVHAEEADAEAGLRRVYEEFCASAGMAGEPSADLEILVCAGSSDFVDKKRKEFAPDMDFVKRWRWRYWRDDQGALTKVYVFLVVNWVQPDAERLALERMSEAFGLVGESKEFAPSAFYPDTNVARLSDEDRRLLRVMYRHVPLGSGREVIVRIVNERWANPDRMAGP